MALFALPQLLLLLPLFSRKLLALTPQAPLFNLKLLLHLLAALAVGRKLLALSLQTFPFLVQAGMSAGDLLLQLLPGIRDALLALLHLLPVLSDLIGVVCLLLL